MPARREIVIICGPMFSQKTLSLLSRTKKAQYAGHKVLFINPETNLRDEDLKSRDGFSAQCVKIPPKEPEKILRLAATADVVAIDEAQFFGPEIVPVVQELFAEGKRVLVACLDTDLLGNPFGPVPKLLSIPEAEVIRRRAVCENCKHENATRTDLKDKALRAAFKRGENPVLTGDQELYQALCYDCFRAANSEDFENNNNQEETNIAETRS
jgi:thymidine kinase